MSGIWRINECIAADLVQSLQKLLVLIQIDDYIGEKLFDLKEKGFSIIGHLV